MPRGKAVNANRASVPDPIYGSVLLNKFVKRMMIQGKYSICLAMMDTAMKTMADKSGKPALEVFNRALENVKPVVEVKSRRVGGSTYQVPVEIREPRREALAMRWIITASRNRSGKSFPEKLSAELLDAFNATGTAFKKKEDTHKMAEANKAFSHYKW